MKRKVLGAVLIIAGAVLMMISRYINEEVASGRMRIAKGQQQVNTINNAFNATPYTRGAGGIFTGGAQQKIDEGAMTADYYANMAQTCNVAGIVLIVAGIGILLIPRFRPR